MEDVPLDQLVADARALLRPGHRALLGLTGAPGAGKSTVAEQLVAELGGDAMLVGLDGFHLADDELRRMGRGRPRRPPRLTAQPSCRTCTSARTTSGKDTAG